MDSDNRSHTRSISRTTADQVITGIVTAEGEFDQDAEGRDLAHWANGTVQIIEKDGKRYIQLTEAVSYTHLTLPTIYPV